MSEQTTPAVRRLVITMAEQLEREGRNQAFDNDDRIRWCQLLTDYTDPDQSALLARTPRIEQPTTRGAYARLLREEAGAR